MTRFLDRWGAVGALALLLWIFLAAVGAVPAWAGPPTVEELQREIDELRRLEAEREERLRRLERQIEEVRRAPAPVAEAPAPSAASALDAALADLPEPAASPSAPSGDLWSRKVGGATVRLMDLSLVGLVYGGGSTARELDEVDFAFAALGAEDKHGGGGEEEPEPAGFSRGAGLLTLQGGGHDPRKRGFTLAQLELSAAGAVDPWFTAETHLLFFLDPIEGETSVELEEAFMTTTFLPYGFALEVGQSFTEFGVVNPTHPHVWDWMDQPIVLSRLFGPDGMRGVGARLDWLTPLPWFSELSVGMQNAGGETMVSFLANDEVYEEAAPAGRPFLEQDVRNLGDFVYHGRWANGFDLSDNIAVKIGASGIWGPNATGSDGWTTIYGGDLVVLWRPETQRQGYPFVKFQGEVLGRTFHADRALAIHEETDEMGNVETEVNFLDKDDVTDWGFYTQLSGGLWTRWGGVQAGLRYEYVTGDGSPTVAAVGEARDFELLGAIARRDDPLRADRHRLSPMIAWRPSEFSRVRLQYNYDRASWLPGDEAHTLWVGFDFLLGTHPAHRF